MIFSDLKAIVDLIRTGVKDRAERADKIAREAAVVEMLKIYFVLSDVADEGARLLQEAGPDPFATLSAMAPAASAEDTMVRWEVALFRQHRRLQFLDQALCGQEHMSVVSPDLAAQIKKVVGSKNDRVVTLYVIGAGLFFRFMFGGPESLKDRAAYVVNVFGPDDDLLDCPAIAREIIEFRESLDRYRELINRFVSNDELLKLSSKARHETDISETSQSLARAS